MRVILHLGCFKTATSSLQNHLFRNRSILREQGILYPAYGTPKSIKLGARHSSFVYSYTRGKTATALPGKLADEIFSSGCHTVILSSEAWSNAKCGVHLLHLINELNLSGVREILGILSLRNVCEYQISHYREFTVNQRNTLTYESFLADRHRSFDYRFLLSMYRIMLGDNLRVAQYEKSPKFLPNLIKLFELSDTINTLFDDVPRENVKSLSAVDVEILRVINTIGIKSIQRSTILSNIRERLIPALPHPENHYCERYLGDVPDYSKDYIKTVQEISGLSHESVEHIYEDMGANPCINVKELTAAIIKITNALNLQ